MDTSVLHGDIVQTFGFSTQNPESAVEICNSVFKDIVDKHAHEKSNAVVIPVDAEWYAFELVKPKRHRRKLEHNYNKTKLAFDKRILIFNVKSITICSLVPSHDCNKDLGDDNITYFDEKLK